MALSLPLLFQAGLLGFQKIPSDFPPWAPLPKEASFLDFLTGMDAPRREPQKLSHISSQPRATHRVSLPEATLSHTHSMCRVRQDGRFEHPPTMAVEEDPAAHLARACTAGWMALMQAWQDDSSPFLLVFLLAIVHASAPFVGCAAE